MRKYAVDLLTTDRIVHPASGRVILIDSIEPSGDSHINVSAFFEDDGESWDVRLDHDNEMVIV